MDELEKVKVATASIIIALYCDGDKKPRKRRSNWVKPWLQFRDSHGFYTQLLSELILEEPDIYKNYLRMTAENFDEILSLIKADICKKDTMMRDSVPPEIQLAITIRFFGYRKLLQRLVNGISCTPINYRELCTKSLSSYIQANERAIFSGIILNIYYIIYYYKSLDCR